MSESPATPAESTADDDCRRLTAVVQLWNARKAPLCPGLRHGTAHSTRRRPPPMPAPMTVTSYGYAWHPGMKTSLN